VRAGTAVPEATDEAAGRTDEARAAGLRRVLANGVSLLFAYILPRGGLFVSAVVAARVLGAAGFGLYGTAAAFAVILSIVATLGMLPLLVREIARAPDRAGPLLRAADALKTVANAAMLGLLVVLAAGPLGYSTPVVAAAVMLGAAYAMGAYVENLAAYFQAVERMHVWTAGSAVYGLITAVVGVAAVLITRDIVWYAASPLAGQVAALVWLRRQLPPTVRAARTTVPDVLKLARAVVPFAAAFVALTVYSKIDVLLLAAWRTAEEVGVYTAAYKFVDLTRALALVAAAAVYPRLSRATGGARGAATGRVAELLLLGALPAAGALWLARGIVIDTLYGAGYAAAAPVLGLLAPALVPLTFNLFAGYSLAAADRMRAVAIAYGAALVLNVGLNALLVPRYGATGAAAAMLVSEITLSAGLAAVLRHTVGARFRLAALGTLALAVAACAALPLSTSNVPAQVAGFVVVVALLYWRTGVLPAHDVALLRAALRRPAHR